MQILQRFPPFCKGRQNDNTFILIGRIKAFLGCSDWIKVFYRKEGLS
nr:MAG TPA: hypothetical protein [Caudoviricetes sp.]